jgi:predicted HTH domain antitoxin
MANVVVEVPEELLDQLKRSRFAKVGDAERVRVALAIQLFVGDEISVGRAAELAGYRLVEFHDLLRELDVPTAVYDQEEYDRDQPAVDSLRERLGLDGGR